VDSVIGIDPLTGTQKFSVTLDDWPGFAWGIMIAGDGYAYVTCLNREFGAPGSHQETNHLNLMQVSSSGVYNEIKISDWLGPSTDIYDPGVSVITNADQGTLLTWNANSTPQMAMTSGAGVSVVSGPAVGNVVPVLQAQDGSFVGTSEDSMVAFDAGGNVRWAVPNMCRKSQRRMVE